LKQNGKLSWEFPFDKQQLEIIFEYSAWLEAGIFIGLIIAIDSLSTYREKLLPEYLQSSSDNDFSLHFF
jgi:hypothetical protein